MPWAEFEERSYELPMDFELGQMNLIFAPGLVLEKTVGFDAAMLSSNQSFWAVWGSQPSGQVPDPRWWGISPSSRKGQAFPKCNLNLFVQYKRPYYLSGLGCRRPAQWDYWLSPYYRYPVDDLQQKALGALVLALTLFVGEAPELHGADGTLGIGVGLSASG